MNNADMPAMPSQISIHRDNGEAIPYQFGNNDFVSPGVTKREHFAAMAMQGLLAANAHRVSAPFGLASDAVDCADALLSVLENKS